MAAYSNAPWWADAISTDDIVLIRDANGEAVAGLMKMTDLRSPEEQEANAELITLAPEMFASLNALIRVMRKSDAENSDQACDSEEWDAALEDAEALIDLLSEAGVTNDFTLVEAFPS